MRLINRLTYLLTECYLIEILLVCYDAYYLLKYFSTGILHHCQPMRSFVWNNLHFAFNATELPEWSVTVKRYLKISDKLSDFHAAPHEHLQAWARGGGKCHSLEKFVFCALLMTVKHSVCYLLMHFFQNICRLLGALPPNPKPHQGSVSGPRWGWNPRPPNLPTPRKKSCGHPQ